MKQITKQDIEGVITQTENIVYGAQGYIKQLHQELAYQNKMLEQAKGELERIYNYLEDVYRNNRDNQYLYNAGKRCEFVLETLIKYGQIDDQKLLSNFDQFFSDTSWVMVNKDAWRNLITDAE